jgi:lysozyme
MIKRLLGLLRPKKTPTASSMAPWVVPDLELIKTSEGLSLKAYLCPANKWTIGYGHTATAHRGRKITQKTANKLLLKDLKWVKDTIDNSIVVALTTGQLEAVYSLVYNIGGSAWRKSTLLVKLNKGDYDGAAAEFNRWNKGGGQVLTGLVIRREAETKLFKG